MSFQENHKFENVAKTVLKTIAKLRQT